MSRRARPLHSSAIAHLALARPKASRMFLVPYRKTEISSPHSPAIVTERLRQRTSARQPWFRSLVGRGFDFTGSVSASEFRFMPVIRGQNTYQPWLVGRVCPSPDGSTIRVIETFHPVQIGILVAFFTIPAVLGMRSSGIKALFVALLVFLLFHCVMYFIGFLPEARRAEERIRELTA